MTQIIGSLDNTLEQRGVNKMRDIIKIISCCTMACTLLVNCAGKKAVPDNLEPSPPTGNPRLPSLVEGTATNPIIKGDAPDPSLIRVGDAYYMVSTTMYFCPVAPIMKSYDLVNWRIVSYCTDILEDLPAFRLETENENLIGDYSRGQWASSLRYYHNHFWVIFTNNTTNKSYLFSSKDPENDPWVRREFSRRFHDPSLFFDEDTGRMYIFHGYRSISVTEMEADLRAVKPGGLDKVIMSESFLTGYSGTEGAHAYKKDGYYYVFLISWMSGRRVVLCYRATDIQGPYEGRLVLAKGLGARTGGVAQGGVVETPDGDWYGFFFQDRDAVGRVPVLVPMYWSEDHWPVFGDEHGNIPLEFEIKLAQGYEQNLYVSDEFEEDALPLAWQWNHNPDNYDWSLTERPGYLRLKTGRTARTIFHARNTLTQRTFEPACQGTIALETANMKDGDIAGLAALGSIGGFVGIQQDKGQKYIVMYTANNDGSTNPDTKGNRAAVVEQARAPFDGTRAYFRLNFRFRTAAVSTETASFQYSLDGENWQNIGTTVYIRYTLNHFTGYRFGLFNYATEEAGGYVDFDYFRIQ
jgi:beta-xylosidase